MHRQMVARHQKQHRFQRRNLLQPLPDNPRQHQSQRRPLPKNPSTQFFMADRLSTYTLTIPSEWHVTDLTKLIRIQLQNSYKNSLLMSNYQRRWLKNLFSLSMQVAQMGLRQLASIDLFPQVNQRPLSPRSSRSSLYPATISLTLEQYLATAVQTVEDGKLEH